MIGHDRQLRRLRELDALPLGTLVLATSSPAPRYFLRVAGGWHAADSRGRTDLHETLHAELSGWPTVLRNSDLRRPVYVVARPDELDATPTDSLTRSRNEAARLVAGWAA